MNEQSSGGPATAGGLRKPTPSRPQLPSMLPMVTAGMSNFLAEQEADDSASFSSLLAGAINADKKRPDGETDDRSSSEVRDTMSKCLSAGAGPIKPTTARFKSMPPSRIPIPKAPCVTIPPGLSPTTLLDSPVLLSSHQAEPSPTTGTYPLPPLLGEAGTKSSDGSKERTPDQNTFLFKPFPKPGSRSLSPLGSTASVPFSFPQPIQERPQLQAQPLVTPEASSSFPLATSSPPPEQELQLVVKADKSPEQSQSSAMGETDGYNWRKYGQKLVKGSENPRSYYKCTYVNCPMKKKVERSPDGQVTEIVYEGEQHNHPKPQPTRRTAMMSGAPRAQITSGAADGSDAFRNQSNGTAGEQSSSSTSDDEGNEDEPDGKRRKKEKQLKESPIPRTVREPRVVVQTTSEVDVLDDGYRWRKYGQKVVKGNPHPRSYYKCTNLGCPVRKHVERACDDPKAVITTYEGKHNHDVPAANPRSGAHDRIAAAAMEIVPSQRSDGISFPTPATSLDQQVSRPSGAAVENSNSSRNGDDLVSMTNRVKAELQEPDGFLPTGSPSRISAASGWPKPELQDNGLSSSSMLLLRP